MTRRKTRDSSTDRDGNVTLSNERYLSLAAELIHKYQQFYRANTLTSLGGSYPANVDEWDATFDPVKVLNKRLRDKGYSREEINALSPIIKEAFALFMEIAISSHVLGHGKPPGMPDEDAHFEEPVSQ